MLAQHKLLALFVMSVQLLVAIMPSRRKDVLQHCAAPRAGFVSECSDSDGQIRFWGASHISALFARLDISLTTHSSQLMGSMTKAKGERIS